MTASKLGLSSFHRAAPQEILTSRALQDILSEILLNPASRGNGTFQIVERNDLLRGFFPKEVVNLRTKEGRERKVLCKYEMEESHASFGHRGGIRYEAVVYRNALAALDITVPELLGTAVLPRGAGHCLVLEYLPGALHVSKSTDPEALTDAARWIARFHRLVEPWMKRRTPALRVYDGGYYAAWAERAISFVDPSDPIRKPLVRLRDGYRNRIPTLLAPPRTLIHGEYYPENVLVSRGTIHPVDWESAAVASGEIDLAALTEGWPEEVSDRLTRTYVRERWDGSAPASFHERLAAARLYLAFRWLGEKEAWTARTLTRGRRRERLRSLGQRLGLLASS